MKLVKAFTFIELLVVLAMISIMFAIAIPAYSDYITKAKVAESFLLAIPLEKAVRDYHTYYGQLPENNQTLGLPAPEQIKGDYVDSISIKQGRILIKLKNQTDTELQGKMIILTPKITQKAISWYCEENDPLSIAEKYLGSCRKS